MSRCFPFPPPGYEKKTIVGDLDLPKKEKQKEKKHKKEKKDKEKREAKEKREKDKSDGKHRDKRDKKEKNRDKKDKDEDRDKDKSSNLDGKRLPGHSEGDDREKISNAKRFPGEYESRSGEIALKEKISTGRPEDHNGNRVLHEKRLPLQFESHSGEKIVPKEKDKHTNNISNERRFAGQFADNNGEKVSRSIPSAEVAEDSKFAQGLNRRVRDENRGPANHFVDKFTGSDQKREERMLNTAGKATVNGGGGLDKKDTRCNDKAIDGQGIRDDTRYSGKSIVENYTEMVETRVEGTVRPSEEKTERKMEGKEKTKEKGGDDKRRDKRKDRDKEKKSQGKDRDRDRDKERKKEEKKAKEKNENKTMKQNQVKESIIYDTVGTHDVKVPYISEDSNKNAVSEANLRKRKDTETNGFMHANESGPNKLPRSDKPSHSSSKNGRILDPCQAPIPDSSDRKGAATNLNVDSKNRKVNGTAEAQLASSTKMPISESSSIPPHPDSKYLSQILSVPKLEELSNSNEQDWLFCSGAYLSKKSKSESCRNDETPMVWSEALRIESADVYALPYVIPY